MTNSTVGIIGFGQSAETTVCQNDEESPSLLMLSILTI